MLEERGGNLIAASSSSTLPLSLSPPTLSLSLSRCVVILPQLKDAESRDAFQVLPCCCPVPSGGGVRLGDKEKLLWGFGSPS